MTLIRTTLAAGAAVLCSARAPACRDCPGQRLEVAARAVTVTPLRRWYAIKLSDNLSPRLCHRPLHGVARGCAGLGAAVPAAPRSITYRHLRTAHNWAL